MGFGRKLSRERKALYASFGVKMLYPLHHEIFAYQMNGPKFIMFAIHQPNISN